MDKAVKVLVVDDDSDFARLIEKRIVKDKRLAFVGNAAYSASGVDMARSLQPDVVVMDLSLSGDDDRGYEGVEAAKEIRISTNAKIVLLTAHEDPETMKAASKNAFASAFVCKSHYQTLTDDIYYSATSDTPQKEFIKELVLNELSPAERAVLDDFIKEKTLGGKGGAYSACGSCAKTIANQKRSILNKLKLRNTKELMSVFGNW